MVNVSKAAIEPFSRLLKKRSTSDHTLSGCNLLEIKNTILCLFLYIVLAIQHNSRHWYWLFYILSGSCKMHVLFAIFIFFYHFYGNIDCIKKYSIPNFHPFPVTCVSFISTRLSCWKVLVLGQNKPEKTDLATLSWTVLNRYCM